MMNLSKPDNPGATKYHRMMWISCELFSYSMAYAFCYLVATVAKWILK
jgi:hypothetical protein